MDKSILAALYDAHVRELADQQKAAVRKQLEKAFLEQPPQNVDDVDPWFLKHFHRPPVSHDTILFNRLRGMTAAIRSAFTPGEEAAKAE